MPMDPTTFRKLMALEPLASDPTVPVAEVVRRMEEINPYRGMYVPAEPEDEGDEIEIEWMTP